MSNIKAVVVGAGIAGAMSALELKRKGADVTLIDRWEPGHPRASSSDYSRIIRAISGKDKFYTQWVRDSIIKWRELENETKQKLYYQNGTLILATEGKCKWEDATTEVFEKLRVPYNRFTTEEIPKHFPQFQTPDIKYALYEPESGIIMAHRAVITTVNLFQKMGGALKRGTVTTDQDEKLMLNKKYIEADVIVVATGPWMAEMFKKTIAPITTIIGINVLYTSTPDGNDKFEQPNMPCWIDHGMESFGLPSVEGSGVKAAVVIPNEPIDINNDERLIRRESLTKTRAYIKKRLPGLIGQKIVDSKFNQIILTPDTNFIVDWHPVHDNVLLAGGCSGHLFKHGPVFGEFTAGVALKKYGTAERFKIKGRKKLNPGESPSGR